MQVRIDDLVHPDTPVVARAQALLTDRAFAGHVRDRRARWQCAERDAPELGHAAHIFQGIYDKIQFRKLGIVAARSASKRRGHVVVAILLAAWIGIDVTEKVLKTFRFIYRRRS